MNALLSRTPTRRLRPAVRRRFAAPAQVRASLGGSGPAGSEGNDPAALRFSVVVPALDEAAHLGQTLRSLQSQDLELPFEIIVVDNGSTDETADIARAHGARVLDEPRRGVCAARQRGAEAARGAIIVSTDADTVHPPDWLRTIDATFTTHPDAVAVAGPCRYDDGPAWTRRYPALVFSLVATVAQVTGRVIYVSATNLAVRRSAFPGYDLEQTQGGDELDLLRRLRPQGPVLWDRSNAVVTSPRRLERGLVHGLLVSLLGRYVLTYLVNRLARRRVLGTAPPVRDERDELAARSAAADRSAVARARAS